MIFPFAPRFSELLLLLVLGNGMGVPLGIPPAPDDPAVSRAAPEECLFFLSWTGMAKPDPASPNQAEQLLAEKEVQHCLAEIESRVMDFLRQETANDPQGAAMVEPVAAVVKAVLTSPTALFVSKIDPASDERPIRGGALVSLGDKAAEVGQALAKIGASLGEGAAKSPAERDGWRRLPLGAEGMIVEWGIKGKYLIIGVGEGEADRIRDRMRQDPPQWLAQLREQLTVPRPASVVYVNAAAILKTADPLLPPDGRDVLEALGLNRIRSLASVSGLDDLGCVSKTQVAVDGELTGLLSMLASKPLAKEHLSVVPKDATIAAAVRFDLAKAYRQLLDMLGRTEPRAREDLLSGLGRFEEQMNLKLSRDIFESLGDVWRVYNSPGEGGLVLTGLTAVVNLRDHDRLVAANAKLVFSSLLGGAARQITGRESAPRGPRITQTKFGENTIFSLNLVDRLMPFAPSWCITDNELIAALFPQNVKAYLSRAAGGGSLADVPAAAGLFAGDQAPVALAYCDTPGLFKMAYPIVQIVAQLASGELRRQGINVDVSLLPSAPSILRHLQPTVAAVRRTKAGVMIETRRTLPGGAGGAIVLAQMIDAGPRRGFGLGDLPTPQNTSINNLKQIALALHNFHDVYRRFPASAGPQKPGQPPVSWRVLILPYVGEAALYQQYRFDEPWDSEHNKKLAAQMPAVFKAPGSKAAAQGKTNYLALVGDRYAFAAAKGRSFAEFTDGTSNTIMVVEVSDAKAVPWTKPEDLTPDPKDPIAGLVGLRPGGFLAGLTDGSVRRIPAAVDAATLNALFTRAGGEPVSAWDLDESRGRMAPRPKRRPVKTVPPPAAPAAPPGPQGPPRAPGEPMSEAKPAAPKNTVPVSGMVTFQGKPVEGATVTFLPRAPGSGRPSVGRTDAAGMFTLSTFAPHDGAPPGQYTVTIATSNVDANAPPGSRPRFQLPAQYASPRTSPLVAEIKDGAGNQFGFELAR